MPPYAYSLKQYRKALGEILHKARKAAGLTQDEVAAKLELDRSHLSGLESGKHDPGCYKLAMLAKLYGFESFTQLIGEVEARARMLGDKARERKQKNKNNHS